MTIVQIQAQSNGAHANQTTSTPLPEIPEGWAVIPDDLTIPDTFPFIDITVKGQVVTAITPGVVPEPEPIPEVTLPPTNEMLSAQVQAVNDRQEFLEDCIAEMAQLLYS